MNAEQIRKLLEEVASGSLSPSQASERLATLPYAELQDGDLGFAKLDLHRELRSGLPEAVFAEGKSAQDLSDIVKRLLEANGTALATRVSPERAAALANQLGGKAYPDLVYNRRAGIARWGQLPQKTGVRVAILAAGTSDLPVAEEVAETLAFTGVDVDRYFDVGVAGLHRLLAHLEDIRSADVVIAVAGMDGALPTVVAGLVTAPVLILFVWFNDIYLWAHQAATQLFS